MMLYLSRLALNPRCRQVRSELFNPYEMHRTLSKAFGDAPGIWESARCLFRVEESPDLRLLVQSHIPADWARLSVPGDYMADRPAAKEFSPAFTPGQRLAFRLRANPTVRRDGRRQGLYQESEQLAWLTRKSERGGFRLCSAVARGAEKITCRTASGEAATFSAVMFDGVLRVTEPDALRAAIEGGVGAGKGIGFGLLSLARLR